MSGQHSTITIDDKTKPIAGFEIVIKTGSADTPTEWERFRVVPSVSATFLLPVSFIAKLGTA